MPFKSKAQRRKFAQLLVDGEITPEVYEEWNRETGSAALPEGDEEALHTQVTVIAALAWLGGDVHRELPV